MDGTKSASNTAKIVSNAIYSIGALITLCLVVISLFGPDKPMNPEAMLPSSWKTSAFIWLAIGSVPMLFACMAVYESNDISKSKHKKRIFILIFLPGFICLACALFIVGILFIGAFQLEYKKSL